MIYRCVFVGCVDFFFFKQKTAYEMRISDWSSDVCSSDLYEGKTQLNIRANEVDIMSSRKDQNESGGHRNRDGMGGNSLPPQEELDDSVPFISCDFAVERSEEHTSELQSLMRISYAVFCLKKKKQKHTQQHIMHSSAIHTTDTATHTKQT